jgi:acyl carrier protein
MEQALEQLQQIFRDVFDDEALVITPETSARDIREWDSLAHINLLISIERAFAIRFSLPEVNSLAKVADLLELIAAHQGGPALDGPPPSHPA